MAGGSTVRGLAPGATIALAGAGVAAMGLDARPDVMMAEVYDIVVFVAPAALLFISTVTKFDFGPYP